ncbi:encapsidation protein [Rhizobium phage RHph_N3_8]|uniref:encapsidation protein n=1 Tax=Rhizobium phage RHph_N3_8 TaxID=2509748 RepID=UPI001AF0ED47|nr:encapsidation protein [Rhizobium phage RHph_N3_8]QIG76018.1 encapsidation protein [Rhizobium phage RHph_N3_8]
MTIATYNLEQRLAVHSDSDMEASNKKTRSQSSTGIAGQVQGAGADLPYYSFDTIYSYNGVFNFVCGARGLGKTFGAKEKVIKKFLKTGEQFIYLRRYKTELKAANTFFDDIKFKFPSYQFRKNGNQFEVCKEPKKNRKDNVWEIMGFAVALSTAQNQKSVAYPLVRTIIFDEFIIEKGLVRYLPDEATVMINFLSTVDRNRNNTRVLFLANSVSIENPYFIKWKIRPESVGQILTAAVSKRTGLPFIVAHFVDSKEFNEAVYQTRFGEFIQGTEYADYALGNEFADNHALLIEKKPSEAEYAYTLQTQEGTFSIWFYRKDGTYYLQQKLPGNQLCYTLLPNKVTSDNTFLASNDEILKQLRRVWKNGLMRFDEAHTRNAMLNIFA